MSFLSIRPKVPKLLFIITDGESNDPAKTALSAKELHDLGITVFAIGVGGAKQTDLLKMASNASLIYTYNDFNKLAELQDTFIKRSCDGRFGKTSILAILFSSYSSDYNSMVNRMKSKI